MDIVKEILKINKETFRILHNLWGYDFQKEYKAYKYRGEFTIASLLKEFDLSLSCDKIVLLVKFSGYFVMKSDWYDYLKLVEINNDKTVNVNCVPVNTKIHYFFNKSDFNKKRKEDNCCVYIISQDKKYLEKKWVSKEDKKEFYRNNRFELIRHEHGSITANLFHKNSNKEYQYTISKWKNCNNMIVDKSGYIVDIKRAYLEDRVCQLRNERLKNEYLKMDYSDKLLEVDNMKNTIKIKLLDLLTNCDFTYNLFDSIDDFDVIIKTKRILNDIEDYKKSTNKKIYCSIIDADKVYDNIVRQFVNIVKRIEAIKTKE